LALNWIKTLCQFLPIYKSIKNQLKLSIEELAAKSKKGIRIYLTINVPLFFVPIITVIHNVEIQNTKRPV